MEIQILTDRSSWFFNNKDKTPIRFRKYLKKNLISDHHKIKDNYDLTIIISYYKIIPKEFLLHSKHNLVIHESNLPKGRGMSPLYWQILKGETKVIFTLFECSQKMDDLKQEIAQLRSENQRIHDEKDFEYAKLKDEFEKMWQEYMVLNEDKQNKEKKLEDIEDVLSGYKYE